MGKIIGLGEILMRLNPEGYRRLVQANTLEISYAGSEANAIVTCANCGMDTAFVTKFPDNELGRSAANELRRWNVDTRFVQMEGRRLGLYFLENGASQRDTKVVYDRAGSAIAEAKRTDFDWDVIFADADWFHFSGITPALGGELPEITMDALKAARKRGIPVSCDINYRKNLWTAAKAGEILVPMMEYVDVCCFNETEATICFGVKPIEGEERYESIARQLVAKFGFKQVAVTLSDNRFANENNIGGYLYEDGRSYYSENRRVLIADRVGAGDCFAGALIVADLKGFTPQHAVDFAAAACCLKCTYYYDFSHDTFTEIEKLATSRTLDGPQR